MNITEKEILRLYGWSESPTISECAKNAYRDLSRTMDYMKPNPNDKIAIAEFAVAKQTYKECIYKIIQTAIEKILSDSSLDLDKWHEETCSLIVRTSNENKIIGSFQYGQAQKWLNMTFKYMLLHSELRKRLGSVEDKLHVPVDKKIIEKARRLGGDLKVSDTWSLWDYNEYMSLQHHVRGKVKDNPIEWEFRAWLD